ncbi:MAG: FAD-dependent oxidoreductase [bacterium]|nr:FAD-dependent oxidoreductase [bacterium]
MVNHVTESARELPVASAWDVVVAGGGIAGVAAAAAAARNGASVCLLEKAFGLGGLATLGNVIVYLPICDGMGRQVMGGLAEELLHLSVADLKRDNPSARFNGVPPCWQPGGDLEARKKTRFRTDFNPASYQLALEKLLVDEGVKILYDTRVCAVDTDAHMVRHVIIENKSGRTAMACGAVVDATGDADICYLAGEETESLDSNVLAGWFYTLDENELKLRVMSNKFSEFCDRENSAGPFFRGDDGDSVSAHTIESHALMREKLAEFRSRAPESDLQIVMHPSIACFRMTRRLVGAMSLGKRHIHTWFDDMVGYSSDWRRRGPVYAIPMRTLCGVEMKNLTAVGRCMSADTTLWDVTRAIPTCALTGEAAATASALAVREYEGNIHAVPIKVLQERLRAQGGLLSPDLIQPPGEETLGRLIKQPLCF